MRVLLHGNTIANAMGFLTGYLVVMAVIAIGACLWEVRLSKEEEYWKGLILPFAALLIGTRLLGILLLIIFGVNRQKMKKIKDLEEMKIKDL